jgi:hypothetical protein
LFQPQGKGELCSSGRRVCETIAKGTSIDIRYFSRMIHYVVHRTDSLVSEESSLEGRATLISLSCLQSVLTLC